MVDFPQIKRETTATYKGNFYVKNEQGKWYKMELYLPCATGTLNENLDITASRFLNEIENGTRPFKHAISDDGSIKARSMNKFISKWFNIF